MIPTDNYISREAVIKIIEKGIKENMYHTSCDIGYISQEFSEALKIIELLPSLPDKSIQIREMVEKKIAFDPQDEFSSGYKKMGEELLSEIESI